MLETERETRARATDHEYNYLVRFRGKPEKQLDLSAVPSKALESQAGPTADRSWLRTIYPYSLDSAAARQIQEISIHHQPRFELSDLSQR